MLLRCALRQAGLIRRLTTIIEQQGVVIGRLRVELDAARREADQVHRDVELVFALVPPDKRRLACSFIRDRHDIARLDETEEAGA